MITRILLNILCTMMLFASSPSRADETSHLEQVEILFKLTRMEQKVNESVRTVADLQLRQNPALGAKRELLLAFLNRHIGWQAMRGDITEMYLQTFTEEELKFINDFYITTTGQKVITIVPQLVQERNQLAMRRLQKNIGELHALMQDSKPEP